MIVVAALEVSRYRFEVSLEEHSAVVVTVSVGIDSTALCIFLRYHFLSPRFVQLYRPWNLPVLSRPRLDLQFCQGMNLRTTEMKYLELNPAIVTAALDVSRC